MGPDSRSIWRRRGEYEETVFAETDKYPKISVHLWGAIGVGFRSPVAFFDKTVNSEVYVTSLKTSGFVGLADATLGGRQWCLVRTRASCQTSAQSLGALFEICNLDPGWLPDSPDLNPSESLCGAIKRRLKWGGIQTRNEAIQLIQNVWPGFDQGFLDSLAASFENCVEMMEQAEAHTVRPLISAGKTEVPPGYAEALRTPATWNEQLDEILVRMVDERGEMESYMWTPGRLYRKRMQESVDVPHKSKMFEIRWCHIRSK
jgi:hypothetical protein